jgi:ubiquinone/menaquinone biosynthesis C-methylase UbiE/uncharacterized protein YbaR (Trm112 family)
MGALDPWYLRNLVCPVDRSPCEYDGKHLISKAGRRYPVIDGLAIMLVADERQTIGLARRSIERASGVPVTIDQRRPEFYLETLGINELEKVELLRLFESDQCKIDPVAIMLIGATSGYAYKELTGNPNLHEYPIPEIALPPSSGEMLLDLGCSWGRWSVSAARKGYAVVGIDPSLGAVMAARRIARQLGLDIKHVVADARFLPFADASFKKVYSYSVLQHLSKDNVQRSLGEVNRVLEVSGTAKIQMANAWGFRSFQHQLVRRFRDAKDFEVRYWSISELRAAFERIIGETSVMPDCYFGLGWQKSDFRFMSAKNKMILTVSELLKQLSNIVGPLRLFADSVFCTAVKSNAGTKSVS